MRKVWQHKFGWDEKLPEDIINEWDNIKPDFEKANQVSFNRQALNENEEFCHAQVQNMGVSTTLNFLRSQGFWIPKGRSSIKASIKDCKICQKYNNYPKVNSMPKQHMNLIRPFNHVGVDFTGHLFLRKDNTNASSKYFILIFTCLNIRAVHFELLPDMSTKNFTLAFQRFCNHSNLYSDNARSFVKGGDILEKTLESNEFLDELSKNKIKHVRIPVYSVWVGAAWERLIRTLKKLSV
ncbi:uncharacterized protein LOC143032634 [Oratosquilla oratoria]|uniref:uncharacterized protein LOC143032634 n=1 Tax=Oratosquilla oratoria TaxID=337810 RepID=UPI003F76C82A